MAKKTVSYRDWLSNKLKDPVRAAKYLTAARRESPQMFLRALRKVAEANQVSRVAEHAGISRESFYRIAREEGNPEYTSLNGILDAFGLDFEVVPKRASTVTFIANEPATRPDATKGTTASASETGLDALGVITQSTYRYVLQNIAQGSIPSVSQVSANNSMGTMIVPSGNASWSPGTKFS